MLVAGELGLPGRTGPLPSFRSRRGPSAHQASLPPRHRSSLRLVMFSHPDALDLHCKFRPRVLAFLNLQPWLRTAACATVAAPPRLSSRLPAAPSAAAARGHAPALRSHNRCHRLPNNQPAIAYPARARLPSGILYSGYCILSSFANHTAFRSGITGSRLWDSTAWRLAVQQRGGRGGGRVLGWRGSEARGEAWGRRCV